MANIKLLTQPEVKIYWDALAPLIQKGMDRGAYYWDIDDAYKQAMEGYSYVWCALPEEWPRSPEPLMVMLVCLVQRPKAKICFVEAIGGRGLRYIHEGYHLVERWAKENGCTIMEASGRKGWEKVTGWNSCSTIWRYI